MLRTSILSTPDDLILQAMPLAAASKSDLDDPNQCGIT
jgi:hypothetical protein